LAASDANAPPVVISNAAANAIASAAAVVLRFDTITSLALRMAQSIAIAAAIAQQGYTFCIAHEKG
jgi:hypothetical protein